MSALANFHYQLVGPESGPKLVFLHGVMGFGANFRRIAHAFEGEYQILTYDQRGHGRSFHPESGYGPEEYAGDLLDIIDELGWQKIALVGHSMGGRTAFHFGAKYPERLTRLVIEDIGPAMYASGSSLVLRMLDAVPVPFPDKKAAKAWFDSEFLKLFAGERNPQGLAAYLYANLTENEQKQAIWRFYEPGIRESVAQGRATERWEDVRALKGPVLLVRGQFSKDLPREIYDKVLQENPAIEGIEIPNAGHWIHSDQPEAFIRVLTQFFQGEPVTLAL